MENLQIHVLWDCGAAQDVWASCSVHLQKCSHVQEDMLQPVEELISPLEPSELELFLVLTWVIYHRQNAVTCGIELQQPQTLNARARDILEEFHCVQQYNLRPALRQLLFWRFPPTPNLLKISMLLFSRSPEQWGLVWLFVMRRERLWPPSVWDSDEAEILACRTDNHFCNERWLFRAYSRRWLFVMSSLSSLGCILHEIQYIGSVWLDVLGD